MKKILVPTDFSATADNALLFAFELAKKTGASVSLFHGFHEFYTVQGKYTELFDEVKESADNALKWQSDKYASLPEFTGVDVKLHSLPGNIINSLKEIIEITNPDILIMGTNGATGLKEVWVGSNTVKVIENFDLPVIVVPAEANIKPLEQILFPSDLKAVKRITGLAILKMIAEETGSKVTLLNIKKPDETYDADDMLFQSRIFNLLGDSVQKKFERKESINVLDGINEYIDSNPGFGMLAMISRKKNFFDRLFGVEYTKQMAFNTNLPLLVMPDR
jgi:nucleotide-binding universal stress UspA family protein